MSCISAELIFTFKIEIFLKVVSAEVETENKEDEVDNVTSILYFINFPSDYVLTT